MIEDLTDGVSQLELQLNTRIEDFDREALDFATKMSKQDAPYSTKMAEIEETLRRINLVEARLSTAAAASPASLASRLRVVEAQMPELSEVKGDVVMTTCLIQGLSAAVIPLRSLPAQVTLLKSAVPALRSAVTEE